MLESNMSSPEFLYRFKIFLVETRTIYFVFVQFKSFINKKSFLRTQCYMGKNEI